MYQQVKVPAHKPGDQRQILWTTWKKERTNSHKLSSEFHTNARGALIKFP